MSIIQEALKKVQGEIRGGTRTPEPVVRTDERHKFQPSPNPLPPAIFSPIKKRPAVAPEQIVSVVLSVAVIIAVFWLYTATGGRQGKTQPDGTASHQEVAYKPIAGAEKNAVPEEASGRPGADGISAPAPARETPPAKLQYPDFVLNGIMYIEERPQAIINNGVVEEGDMISGAKVIRIMKNGVLMNLNDTEITLSLRK
ncbi:MAG: hypothetical protein WC515_00500 [Candidatus Omnitrophota bacterium]